MAVLSLWSGIEGSRYRSSVINHDFTKQELSVGGGIRNILNVRTIEERNISIYQRYTQSYRLRPRTMYLFLTNTF